MPLTSCMRSAAVRSARTTPARLRGLEHHRRRVEHLAARLGEQLGTRVERRGQLGEHAALGLRVGRGTSRSQSSSASHGSCSGAMLLGERGRGRRGRRGRSPRRDRERLGQFRYIVPTPTPAARAICSIDGSLSCVAKSFRAASNTRCRLRTGVGAHRARGSAASAPTLHQRTCDLRFANRNHIPYSSGMTFRLRTEARADPTHAGSDRGAGSPSASCCIAVLIAGLDSTVLNVAIPTILREFHTTLPSLQWVITGYSLTFAALLIIGGRLGDIFGARRMFIIGAALFGIGSLIASLSTGVPSLVLGEAIIEGIGRVAHAPGDDEHHVEHVRRARTRDRVLGLGRGARRGRRVRTAARRLPHDATTRGAGRSASTSSSRRSRSSARCCSCAALPDRPTRTHRRSRRAPDRVGHVHARVRDQRGRHSTDGSRAEGGRHHLGRDDLAGVDARVDRPVRVPLVGVPALRVLPRAASGRNARTADRCSSSPTCAGRRSGTGRSRC